MPSPACLVSVSGGAFQPTTNGIDAVGGSTIVIKLASNVGVNVFQLFCTNTDEGMAAASVNAGLVIDPLAKTATFTAPANGHAMLFTCAVNNGQDINGAYSASLVTSFGIYTGAAGSIRLFAQNETTQGNAVFGWTGKVNDIIRALSSGAGVGVGGGTTVGVTTSDATPTTLVSAALGNGATVRLAAQVTARNADSSISKTWVVQRTANRGAGVAISTSGATSYIQDTEIVGGADPGWSVSIDAVGTELRLVGTGAAATTVRWFVEYEAFGGPAVAPPAVVFVPPTITSVSPGIGSNAGGHTITLTGTNYLAGATVTCGGVACTSVNVISATTLTCVTPACSAGAKDIAVTVGPNTATSAGAFTALEVAGGTYVLVHAEAGVVTAGAALASVTDQGPAARSFAAGGSTVPTVVTADAAYNNKPLFSFAHPSARLQSMWAVSQPVTRFVVGNTAGTGGLPQYLCDGASGYFGLSGTNTTGGECYANASLTFGTSCAVKQVFCVVYNGASSKVSVSAHTESSGNVGTSAPGGMTIGSDSGGTYGCGTVAPVGKVALVLQVDSVLSLAQRNTNEDLLGAYYAKSIAV